MALYAIHDISGPALQSFADAALTPSFGSDRGLYTLLCMDCYPTDLGLRHLAIFTDESVVRHPRAQRLRVEVGPGQILLEAEGQRGQGFHPAKLTASADPETYTVLYESGPGILPRTIRPLDLLIWQTEEGPSNRLDAFSQTVQDLNGNVHHLDFLPVRSRSESENASNYLFTAIFDPPDGVPTSHSRFRWQFSRYERTTAFEDGQFYDSDFHRAHAASFVRPECVIPIVGRHNKKPKVRETRLLATLWHDTAFTVDGFTPGGTPSNPTLSPGDFRGGTRVVGPFAPGELQGRVNAASAEGFWPLNVSADSWAGHTSVMMVLAPAGHRVPAARGLTKRRLRDELQFQASGSFASTWFDLAAEARFDALSDGRTLAAIAEESHRPSALATLLASEEEALIAHGQAERRPASVATRVSGTVGAGDPPPGGEAEPAVPSEAMLDILAGQALRTSGAHALQLGIAVNGKLKYLNAFTYAEPGYPICTVRNNLYTASCFKPFLGAALLRALGAQGVRNTTALQALTSLPAEPINQAFLGTLTVEMLLRHRGAESVSWDDMKAELGRDPNYPPIPGDFSLYLPVAEVSLVRLVPEDPLDEASPLVPAIPGVTYGYSNTGYDILGEVLAKSTKNDPAAFERALRDHYRMHTQSPLTDDNFHFRIPNWPDTLARGDALRHEVRPGVVPNPVPGAAPPVIPDALYSTSGFDAGSGDIVTPVGEMVRILSSMSSGAMIPPMLDEAELAFCADSAVYPPNLLFGIAGYLPGRTALEFGGASFGGVGFFAHLRRDDPASALPEITVAWAYDTGSLVNAPGLLAPASVLTAASALVASEVWDPEEDLFAIFP